MRLIYIGSGGFACPSLKKLISSTAFEVVGLITQPDKRAGRGHQLKSTPTKLIASAQDISIRQPEDIGDSKIIEFLESTKPDCIVVAAYGQIIPKQILDIPAKGAVNLHASLLPLYRGAAPIPWALARGAHETGVTTMLMDEGLDTGPILMQRRANILPTDTAGALTSRLADQGAELLIETLGRLKLNTITSIPQDSNHATRAPIIRKRDAAIDWNQPADQIERLIRAFDPWPVAHTRFNNKMLRLWRGSAVRTYKGSSPGTLLNVTDSSMLVACGDDTALCLDEVQLEGKKKMQGATFARGIQRNKDTIFDSNWQ